MKSTKKEPSKTLYVKFYNGGAKKVTIPEGCKITFGPLCPGTKGGMNNGEGAIALRVYRGTSQLAVFVKVESFYEVESVSVIQKETNRATKQQAFEEGGITKQRAVSVEVTEWKNELEEPDAGGNQDAFRALKYSQENVH